MMEITYLLVYQQAILAQGSLETVVKHVKSIETEGQMLEPFVFVCESCKRIEIDWAGDAETVIAKHTQPEKPLPNKRGRPKLGVVSKEVTLLPRHWAWLATQRGGASATLRRLVEDASKNTSRDDLILQRQQLLDGFMGLCFGDATGFEEASRALFRNSKVSFEAAIADWPEDFQIFVMDKFNAISELHSGQVNL